MHIALLGGAFFFFFRACVAWLSCRATRESVLEVHFLMMFRYVVLAGPLGLEEFLRFGVVAALILARLQGPLGTAFWRCIFGWLLAMPKLYHHYGPQCRRSWPQDGSNAAVKQPTWRLDGCTCPQFGAKIVRRS